MRIVSFITDPRVLDRILRHRESERCEARILSNLAIRRAPAPVATHNAQSAATPRTPPRRTAGPNSAFLIGRQPGRENDKMYGV